MLVWTIPQNEGNLQNVAFLYLQLIISRSKINLREHTHRGVDQTDLQS
jgi:hypothetical protein